MDPQVAADSLRPGDLILLGAFEIARFQNAIVYLIDQDDHLVELSAGELRNHGMFN